MRRLTDPAWWTPNRLEVDRHYHVLSELAQWWLSGMFLGATVYWIALGDWRATLAVTALGLWWLAPIDLYIGYRLTRAEVRARSWVAGRLFARIAEKGTRDELVVAAFRIVAKSGLPRHLDALASRFPERGPQ